VRTFSHSRDHSRRPACRRGSHMRNPPANALELSPARQPGGISFSLLTLPPLLLAMQPQPAGTDIVLVGTLPVGQVTELHRLQNAIGNQRRAQARSQP